MKANTLLEPKDRVTAGNVLSRLGYPRFIPDHWHLSDDSQLGFIEIPAETFLMGSDRKRDKGADDDE
jgi:hypothetical protein